MEPLRPFTSRVIPLLVDNVDTDQIIPARYLKGTSKDGLGEGLFADWRYDGDGTPRAGFVLNRPEMTGRAVGFSVDPFARQMLLDGTDELGYLLSQGALVAAYEDAHPARVDTTAPAWGG